MGKEIIIQEFGGFVLDAVRTHLNKEKENSVNELLHSLSIFDVHPITENQPKNLSVVDRSVISVFYNLIQRGLPTRFSLRLEQVFSQVFPYIQIEENRGSITSSFVKESPQNLTSLLEQAYHVIDPRLSGADLKDNYQYSWEQLDSTFEEDFYFNTLGNINGDTAWLLQLIECQRPLTEIVTSNVQNSTLASNFVEQRCDFSLEFPHPIQGKKGIILEVDGKQHNAIPQHKLDEARDEAARASQWMETIRIPTIHWSNQELLLSDFKNLLKAPYFQGIANNFAKPLYETREGLIALQLALSPILIARIQKAVLGQILSGCLDLNQKAWTICVIERDIPGSSLAIRDIEESLTYYSNMIEDEFKLPNINLHVYSTPEFIETDLHSISKDKPKLSSALDDCDVAFDLVLDISVLSRDKAWAVQKFKHSPQNYLLLTSAKSRKGNRKFLTGQLLPFHQLTTKDQEGKYIEDPDLKSTLERFLADIFRKKKFRPGQLPILDRALSQESVIGLLPTGGGKSMTYQLATFMQPGISIIIDPIKSLMRDQVNSLSMNLIDSAGYVNSSLDRAQKEIAHNSLVEGELLFFFMSPERLLIPDFRGVLEATHDNGYHFSFCVIDEAHCVSEWGHDFRTSYLFLGRNATLYAKTFSDEPITLFGLTATASYDVLADIQRELSGDIENRDSILSDDAIVRFETFNRPELQYEVLEVNIPNTDNYKDDWEIKKYLGAVKHASITRLLSTMPERLAELNGNPDAVYLPITDIEVSEGRQEEIRQQIAIEDYDPENFWRQDNLHAGIIFCPHRSWYFGVTDKYKGGNHEHQNGIADSILTATSESNIRLGTFIGVDQDSSQQSKMEEDNQNNQDSFINSDLNLMVCTKAFGMGIDKANVRIAIHLNYPQSIESYVQEAGRIGRDGKIALSCIAYNNQEFYVDTPAQNGESLNIDRQILMDFYNNSFPGVNKEKWNLFELLKGIESPTLGPIRTIAAQIEERYDLELVLEVKKNKAGTSNYLAVRNADYKINWS